MYLDHYGFSEPPFQLTPDARFWFESRTHKKAKAYLGYGIAQGEGFVIVTGEIGAGKSTLVAHLLATIDRARLNAIAIVSSQVEGDDLLRLVAHRLGVESTGLAKAALLDRIEAALGAVAATGKRTLLIVDEAQALGHSSLEELRMLSNFQAHGRPLLQILLTGQPEFRERLIDRGLEQLRQRVIATHHLEAMEANEVEPYMLHRLTLAGWTGRPAFDPDAFAALHAHSDGVPRRLNQLANRLLLQAAIAQVETIDVALVDAVAADLVSEQPTREQAHVLPLRGARPVAVEAEPRPAPAEVRDIALERRVASLEARLEEQEVALRRVLTLLVDWVESEPDAPSYRHNAA
ncbi:ExeA family protein [Allosphingosinicella indica]|uniref:Putative secretion ATPase, PEP-CTERM locus subfamily n=1 Tax=Allosphingosinicella indica TaxID=941907 RepID=A0A1X7GWS0_9SPHN|nr:AAA family ATPase [Allosphingosinicella indica]SMF75415.1 putative secretion ATPase, PEP-CTERM locus subfamily [Allosphingosinicella indica]